MCACVCISERLHNRPAKPSTALRLWDLTVFLNSVFWETHIGMRRHARGASVSMRWCKRGETPESSQLNRNTAGVLKVLKEVQSLGAERKVIKEHSASGYMTDNKTVSLPQGRTIAHIDE